MKKMSNLFLVVFVLSFYMTAVYAATTNPQSSFNNVRNTVTEVCKSLRSLLPVASMLMIIGAGVTYAIGQFVGAETRARANVWATNMLIGAIIGLVIAVVAPAALNTLMQNASSTTGSSNWC